MAYNTAILTIFIAIFTVGFRAEQQCGDAEGEYFTDVFRHVLFNFTNLVIIKMY